MVRVQIDPDWGDSELVLTQLPDGKEQRFAMGEVERPNPFRRTGFGGCAPPLRHEGNFDFYLMDKPAPKWWTEGMPRLKLNDELEARQKDAKKTTDVATEAAAHANQ